VQGIFAVPLKAPQALTLGLAMASLGEFSFIVGTSARNELHLMTEETYASVTLAVLFTIFISPTCARAFCRVLAVWHV
jgi:predicted Kef-type K+ transport protein